MSSSSASSSSTADKNKEDNPINNEEELKREHVLGLLKDEAPEVLKTVVAAQAIFGLSSVDNLIKAYKTATNKEFVWPLPAPVLDDDDEDDEEASTTKSPPTAAKSGESNPPILVNPPPPNLVPAIDSNSGKGKGGGRAGKTSAASSSSSGVSQAIVPTNPKNRKRRIEDDDDEGGETRLVYVDRKGRPDNDSIEIADRYTRLHTAIDFLKNVHFVESVSIQPELQDEDNKPRGDCFICLREAGIKVRNKVLDFVKESASASSSSSSSSKSKRGKKGDDFRCSSICTGCSSVFNKHYHWICTRHATTHAFEEAQKEIFRHSYREMDEDHLS